MYQNSLLLHTAVILRHKPQYSQKLISERCVVMLQIGEVHCYKPGYPHRGFSWFLSDTTVVNNSWRRSSSWWSYFLLLRNSKFHRTHHRCSLWVSSWACSIHVTQPVTRISILILSFRLWTSQVVLFWGVCSQILYACLVFPGLSAGIRSYFKIGHYCFVPFPPLLAQ